MKRKKNKYYIVWFIIINKIKWKYVEIICIYVYLYFLKYYRLKGVNNGKILVVIVVMLI